MAPLEITDDYYAILEVNLDATSAAIVASYRKLALKRHPDRSKKHNATADFQLLQEAYETLNDPAKRRAYDIIYPSIKQTPPPRPSAASNSQSGSLGEASQILLLQKSKRDRSERWHNKKKNFESSIFELQTAIWQLENGIKILTGFAAAEAAIEAQKNSWTTWLLSPLYRKVEESEEEKSRKDRARQETKIEIDMKERRLDVKKTELKKEESLLAKAKKEVDDADMADDRKIQALRNIIQAREAREAWERSERDRVERERIAKLRQQERERQEKLAREEAEAYRARQAEERRRKQEEVRQRQQWSSQHAQFDAPKGHTRPNNSSTCRHYGWWTKIHGHTDCPECGQFWTYLLQCPGCQMNACPKCQAAIRVLRNAQGKHSRRGPRSPVFDSDF